MTRVPDHWLPDQLARAWPPEQWQDVTVLIAISGGADSVGLLRVLATLKRTGTGQLQAAHFNHNLRGSESDADEAFVVDLCKQWGIPCRTGRATRSLKDYSAGEGLESAARQARYDFLRQAAADAGARYLATGHTADDQVETILHHVLRGTGIAGLAGMARCRPLGEATTLIRPLLSVRRAQVIEYLATLRQPFRDDSSNAETRFTRNRLRHELLPLLAEQFNPEIDEALLRLGGLAGEVQSIIDGLVEELVGDAETPVADRRIIDAAEVAGKPPYLVRELLIRLWRDQGWPRQSMGYAEWDELADMLLRGRSAKKMFPGGVLVERVEDRLVLRRECRESPGNEANT
ncbi:MAG: tRNA lysidine(34) synthetase TilS [Pirellulaceae bacterium]|nr:tRNA lysidine(34) synthetase TilS [Pirellulaceae bacterium]